MIEKQLSPVLAEYIKDACPKVFWTHNALHLFLRQNGIADNFLSSRHENETKRQFIARLFDNLTKRRDNKGHAVILKIGQALSDMEHFPDLENYEDSLTKITTAKEAVRRVKEEIDKINKKIDAENRGKMNQQRSAESCQCGGKWSDNNRYSMESLRSIYCHYVDFRYGSILHVIATPCGSVPWMGMPCPWLYLPACGC